MTLILDPDFGVTDQELQEYAERHRILAQHHVFDGRETEANWSYIQICTSDHVRTRARIMFTRDSGHHSSGWMKNPD